MSADEMDDGTDGYSGTFRWKKTKKLSNLPLDASNNIASVDPDAAAESLQGWMQYLVSRCGTATEVKSIVDLAQRDLSIIDCLSSPITIASVLFDLKILPSRANENLNVICIGASHKCEERILRETNCWQELIRYIDEAATCTIWLVGPEITTTEENSFQNDKFSINLYRGTSIDFFRSHPSLLGPGSVLFGLNCGFGNWENPMPRRYDLLFSWMPDLYFLTGTKIPLIFTCANDFADVKGEVGVMTRIFGANFIRAPRENLFGFASTLIPPGAKSEGNDYARGNSFWYCVQGCNRSRRITVNIADKATRVQNFLDAFNLNSSGNKLKSAIIPEPTIPDVVELVWHAQQRFENDSNSGESAASINVVSAKSDSLAEPHRSAEIIDSLQSFKLNDEELTVSSSSDDCLPAPCATLIVNIKKSSTSEFEHINFEQEVIRKQDNGVISETLNVQVHLRDHVSTCSISEVQLSFNGSNNEFLVAAPGIFKHYVAALKPIVESTISAKLNKKKRILSITAVVVAS